MRNIFCLAALLGLSCAHRIDPALLRLDGRQDIEVAQNDRFSTPSLVRGSLADLSKIKNEKRPQALTRFLKENVLLFKIADPDRELRLLRADGDDLGFTHYRYERLHREVPVYGDELILHVNDKSQVYQVNCNYHASLAAAAAPSLAAEKAGTLALEQGAGKGMLKVEETALVFYPVRENVRLSWHVMLSGGMNQWEYFIDAATGDVLFDQDRRRF
jgi:Zn-dependent metalloprotease